MAMNHWLKGWMLASLVETSPELDFFKTLHVFLQQNVTAIKLSSDLSVDKSLKIAGVKNN
jgi:hypothetical protein